MEKTLKEELSLFEASGFSMWPFVKQGEKLIIKQVPQENLRTGDIILYRQEGKLICHRIVKIDKEGYLFYTRGDNSTLGLEPVTEEMLLGKAAAVLRNGKMVNLDSRGMRLINRLIAIIAPWVSKGARMIKPVYLRLRKVIYAVKSQ